MELAIQEHVEGKVVWNLGCGFQAQKSEGLLECGASRVVAVDYRLTERNLGPRIVPVRETFQDMVGLVGNDWSPDVVFISWPTQCAQSVQALRLICAKAKALIYLGCNYDGSGCGRLELNDDLAGRRLLKAVETSQNTLLILGEDLGGEYRQTFTAEDIGGLFFRGNFSDRAVTFEEAQVYAQRMNEVRPGGVEAMNLITKILRGQTL